jgi:maltooligosyltrehalose trehalohydrolase
MGEEYGEPAPFQFFTDHIDEKIAVATREGRRREFSAFADFSAEEVPDPQDEATFTRSKLTRDADADMRRLYARLLEARRELPAGRDADAVHCDGSVPWLRVRRGAFTLACNFAEGPATVPVDEVRELVLSTHDGARLEPGGVALPARAGALLR